MVRLAELIEKLKISRPTVYVWIGRGLPVYYVGKIPFFDMREVECWIKQQEKEAGPNAER